MIPTAAREQLARLNNSHPDRPLYLYWLAKVDYFDRRYLEAVEKLKRVSSTRSDLGARLRQSRSRL